MDESKQQQPQHGGGSFTSSFTSGGDSILSEKVSRALQVRTDTPAMKAALDALALLSTTSHSVVAASAAAATLNYNQNANNSSSSSSMSMWIDSRSVRVVMEQDALQQALLLQEQLQQLVEQVCDLREGVTHIAAIATQVQDAIHTNVVVASNNNNTMIHQQSYKNHHSSQHPDDDDHQGDNEMNNSITKEDTAALQHSLSTSMTYTSDDVALEQEQKLASMLFDSFRHRQVSRQRLEAVLTFLEKFDLSEKDARLLDHYAFEDVVLLPMDHHLQQQHSVPVNGMAFLTALHRVRRIRQALGQSFGTSTSGSTSLDLTTTSSSSSSFGATSALRMMESLAQKQEKAYERLYHWLQKFLHLHTSFAPNASTSGDYDAPSSSYELLQEDDVLDEALIQNVFVRRALVTLQHVPAFYAHTLELIAAARRGRETRKFLLALTSGYNGMPPLELKAHDAVQYVGDMLAFMFQQTNMEADVAKNILLTTPYHDKRATSGEGGGETEEEEEEEKDEWVLLSSSTRLDYTSSSTSLEDRPILAAEMVSQAMGGVARPMKSRILQVIANLARRGSGDDDDDDDDEHGRGQMLSTRGGGGVADELDEEGSVARRKTCQLYEICGLLSFYHSALNKTIHKLQIQQQQMQTATEIDNETNDLVVKDDIENSTTSPGGNPLVDAILECWNAATNGYAASLRVYGAMLEQLSVLTGDSEANLAHALMVQLAQVRVVSPGFAMDFELPDAQKTITAASLSQNAAKALSLEWIFETLVDSSLPLCKTLDDAILLKQGLAVAKKSGISSEVVNQLEERIQEQESKLVEGLVEVETTHVLEMCGLGSVATAWKRFREVNAATGVADDIGNNDAVTAVMAGHPGLSQNQLEAAMKDFYASLYSPPLPSLERVVENVTLRKLARQKIASNVADFYTELYTQASRSSSGYTDVSFLGHTPEQVRTLFSA